MSRSGEVVPLGDDGPANRFTSHTRRIVMTTARATPAHAPRTVWMPLMGCSHEGPPPLAAADQRPARTSRGEFERGPWIPLLQVWTDVCRRARGGSLRARSHQERRGGPRLGAHRVGTTRAGDHRRRMRTRRRRRGRRRRARPMPRHRRVSARRLAVDSSPTPASSATSGTGDANATAAPPARPAIATITARSAANHRDPPRPAPSGTARRHLLDSSVGGGTKGTGSPVNVDTNRRSLPPRKATTTGPKAGMT